MHIDEMMTTRCAADVFDSARPRNVLRRALLLVMLILDSFAVPTVAGEAFHFTNWTTQTSMQRPRAKVGVMKEEPRMDSKNDYCEDTIGKM